MFKKILFQLHWFFGISAGLILSIMGVTGAIYSYEQPIQKWLNPNSYTVQVQQQPKMTPAEIYQHFQLKDPEIKINSISIEHDPAAASTVNIVKEGMRKGYNMPVNPYTAEALPAVKTQPFFRFVQDLHRTLTAGNFGKQLTGASTLILLFFVLSGLYMRWPKRHTLKQWLAVKPQLKGRSFLWDLHAVAGTWVAVIYIGLACTGLTWSYDWWKNGMYAVMGLEAPNAEHKSPEQGKGQHKGPSSSETPSEAKLMQADAGHSADLHASKPDAKRNEKEHSADLNAQQIQDALTQTWTGINTQLNRPYSTITLSVPKKSGEMEISFLDAVPQHERARNKAVYSYQTGSFKKLELYEDKKLNEKIMSSMLPVHRGSFFGPVYQFMVMLAALIMPLFFVTGWMLYLKRRKQKQLTQQARSTLTPLDIDENTAPWLIAYASQTGTAEQLAWHTASSLQQARQPVSVKSVQQLSSEDIENAAQVLFIASTYGTGEAPDAASGFEKKIMAQPLNLSTVKYAVLALGSEEYPDSYCQFGRRIDAWMQQSQAQPLFPLIEVNNGSQPAVDTWYRAISNASALELSSISRAKHFDEWTLTKRELLNPDSLGAPAFNIELQPKQDMLWQAGDIAEIQPGNSTERIDGFLKQHQLDGQSIIPSCNQSLKQLLWNRDLSKAPKDFPNSLALLEELPVLPSREYSIASIPEQQVLRLAVRQQSNAQGELGLGSGWLTQHSPLNSTIAMRIRSNPSFHLIDDNRPVILIGNGTGIAGLMSLLSARIRSDYTDNWLIFGERQRERDFFYQSTVEAWQSTGMLKRLDLAFSRDQAEKIYVHHIMREEALELKQWVEHGAVIYVCGSIQGMASDVNQALIDILGAERVEQLKADGRYRRDVY